jgi:uncharacterized membrane protein
MTTLYSAGGWGWCSLMVNVPAMVLLWGAVFTAMVIAVRFAGRQRSDPPASATTGTDTTRAQGVVAARIVRGEMDNDEFHRRLM